MLGPLAAWVWLYTTDVRDWFYIETVWVPNGRDIQQVGYVAARATYPGVPQVPVLAKALLGRGRHKLPRND